MQKIKYIDLFSGIGGFTKAIQDILGDKAECVGFSEIDKYAVQIYQKHFNHKNYGDITKIQSKHLPNFNVLVGGFPCQAFSIAGKRGGFSDTRGTLFFEIARIIKQKQPRLLLLENVKGLLSHDKGATFLTIISTLDELGYDCQWQVLNSKDFGVPQNRERVFIVGHLRGTPRPEVFPFEGTDKENTKKIINPLKGKTDYGWHFEQNVYDEKGITRTVKAGGGSGNMLKVIKISKEGEKKKDQNNAACLTGGGHSGGNHSDMDLLEKGQKIRRLTPKECERLQGFSDDWTKHGKVYKKNELIESVEISDTQRYKTLGNAVTVNVVKEIIKRLLST